MHGFPLTPLSVLFAVNLLLGTANLVPAFPMDGGRLLRAALSLRLGFARATRISVLIGRVLAVLLIVTPLVAGPRGVVLALPLVGLLVLLLGHAEARLAALPSGAGRPARAQPQALPSRRGAESGREEAAEAGR